MAVALQSQSENNLLSKLAPFNVKQVKYIQNSLTSWLNVAQGGKRAGKNVINIIAWCMAIEDSFPGSLHLAAGVTKASAEMNIIHCNGYGVEAFFAGKCRRGTFNKMDALYISCPDGDRIVIIAGGGMKHHFTRIKGNTYETIYLTEVNELHQTFFDECQTRLMAALNKKFFMDLNPKAPNHWFYINFLDAQEEKQKWSEKEVKEFHALPRAERKRLMAKGKKPESYGMNLEHFTIWDNESIDKKKLKVELSRFNKDSTIYKADILGLRITAVGRIYSFNAEEIYINQQDAYQAHYTQFAIGIDVGGTDATVASLVGITPTKGGPTVVLLDGYYHKQGNLQNVMTPSRYIQEIIQRIKEWIKIPAFNGLRNCVIYYDSSEKMFGTELAQELLKEGIRMQVVPSYKGTIRDRIHLNETLITAGRFHIVRRDRLSHWVNAYENAYWSQKDFEDGDFIRAEKGYPIDCLDSIEYAFYPYKNLLLSASAA